MKVAVFDPKALDAIKKLPKEVRRELGKALFDLQKGARLSMPLSRTIASVSSGVEELRIRDRSGAYPILLLHKARRCNSDLPCLQKEKPEDTAE